MSDIIKTWPAFMESKKTLQIFSHDWARFYFTLGRGKPSKTLDKIYFTHRGRILGYFDIEDLVINDCTLPKLSRIDGGESEWQIKPDRWVVVCRPPFQRVKEKLYMTGFRGWHYFSLEEYAKTMESKIPI